MLWVLDVNETLLDVAPVADVLDGSDGDDVVGEWFDRLITTSLVHTATGGYAEFGALAGETAEQLVTARGGSWSPERADQLTAVLQSLPPHADVTGAVEALREARQRVVALTNSSTATAAAQLEYAGLAPLLDAVHSVADAGRLKPAPQPYRMVLEREGYAADQTVVVAAHDWDVAGAAAVGTRTVLLTRSGHRPLPGFPAPDVVAPNLAAALGDPTVRSWLTPDPSHRPRAS